MDATSRAAGRPPSTPTRCSPSRLNPGDDLIGALKDSAAVALNRLTLLMMRADSPWQPRNDGWVPIRRNSALLWHHFEPDHPWRPAQGVERFKPADE